ncbi:phosphoribosylanthranilate isomerase [Mucilaginibacter sp. RS28]|uniref:N-(5'-phosphoribosyl)anthranilate isomerase n=1 Tax=Mucilaginibacter straminoryzae TaxID=2932774 RepID=A0A9X1XAB1_9SPHI|nr:phosphoribosylanthranilate isomerase [Mucilaginibacter straminoryzae]MCJ8211099.1 phosphoribosylanthranilate isomerase [Mucilaginibacter straminoryzae]
MKIKVCGLKETENIKAVAALQPDYIGFIFYPRSPRYNPELSAEALKSLPLNIKKVGVFVNAGTEDVKEKIAQYGLDVVQLHGSESPEECAVLKSEAEVWKAFGVDENFDFANLEAYKGAVDYFLFDTKTKEHGGSGRIFDWNILENYRLDVPFFLSGGLSPENIKNVKELKHPQFFGVDLNSRFETEPGIKNTEQLKQAFAILKQTAEHEI